MDIESSVALVTGANRGLGRALAAQLLARGASVYAAARRPESVDLPGAIPLRLDVTDPASVADAAAAASDVNLLINNAGSATGADLLHGGLEQIRLEMDTHFFGTLAVTRAFAPVLAANAPGAVLNILSVLSWLAYPQIGAYSAAKSAQWAATNALRLQLAPLGITVAGLHVGFMDTEMARGVNAPKHDPAVVAKDALDALASGSREIVIDEYSRTIQAALPGGVAALYPQLP